MQKPSKRSFWSRVFLEQEYWLSSYWVVLQLRYPKIPNYTINYQFFKDYYLTDLILMRVKIPQVAMTKRGMKYPKVRMKMAYGKHFSSWKQQLQLKRQKFLITVLWIQNMKYSVQNTLQNIQTKNRTFCCIILLRGFTIGHGLQSLPWPIIF